MTIEQQHVNPHPHFLETLFAYKGEVGNIFKDALGLYDIDHIAISYIDNALELLTFSSTPSLEFNLFTSKLWPFDKTFQSSWYSLCESSSWQSLYTPNYYDELYQLKQTRHHFPLGRSFAVKLTNGYVIFSIASHKNNQRTRDVFEKEHGNFYKIGQYCNNLLLPLLERCNNTMQQAPVILPQSLHA